MLLTPEEKRKKNANYMRDYYKDPERRKINNERNKLYKELHPEKRKEWLENNKEHIQHYSKQKLEQRHLSFEGKFQLLSGYCRSGDIGAKRSLENLITVDQIRELYDLQEGKCIYTGVDLKIEGPYKISVDRIDSTKSHTYDNCQLTILPINRLKSDLTHEDFLAMLTNIKLNSGMDYKAPVYKTLSSKAKYKVWMLISDMKRRSVKANLNCDIDLKTFKVWRIQQNDICQLTGVPVTWEPHQWNTGSVDRIDSSKGYQLDNIQLVIWPVNMMKNDLSHDDALAIINLIL